ncbi:MAG TPA: ABC transporter ATP-binding protein [Anaerolineae bacterium]|nr:ABC transporter ATP-binding protein [Anaerolineae bacterium]
MSFLSIKGLHKVYGSAGREVVALAGVDLEVAEGEFVVILGPSGCGKTTLLEIVAGLERPTRGEVVLAGRPINGWGRDRTLIFQEYSLFPWLTARENVEFGLRLMGMGRRERRRLAHEILAKMGLADFEDRYPHELSGGMKQRVAIARALAVDPQVLLMDEPFASVDALTRSRLQEELLHIWRECGKTVLFVTHSVREALLLADRVVVLTPRPGRVRAEFRIDLPRPRRSRPAELARWEAELERAISAAPDFPWGRFVV